ncbi:MAG TPA: GNAT family N-acetyltransferase [Gemmatimonadaceae bacterium]|jgi:GNAT superfamily N-acetyltransferase|nr:GNAT family N-acetyltransferase [Gemmatimonadaceae bacterium]
MPDLTIRPIVARDRPAWEPLWAGYLSFYERTIAADVTDFTWKRLTTDGGISGLLAIAPGGNAVGFVHFLFHPTTWSNTDACYLEDLFVAPDARGQRVGRRLIAAVTAVASEKGATSVYWQTEEFNATARRLYERVAKRSPFIRYQIDL